MYKFSIITINLNNVAGLERTIKSVFNQTYKDFEYIIIDGGSKDGSAELISSNSNQLTYWISEPDKGIYQAMNKGIQKASGEYLLFLNSGDFLVNPRVLQRVYKIGFIQDIVVGNCNVSKNGKIVFHATPPEDISLTAFWGKTIPHQSSFFRRDLFSKFGMYLENFHIHADLEFFIRTIILSNCSYLKIPLIISDYNLDGKSSSINYRFISDTEKENIFKTLIPERILFDYNIWDIERKAIEPLVWASNKPFLNFFVKLIYKIATSIVTLRKKIKVISYAYITNK